MAELICRSGAVVIAPGVSSSYTGGELARHSQWRQKGSKRNAWNKLHCVSETGLSELEHLHYAMKCWEEILVWASGVVYLH